MAEYQAMSADSGVVSHHDRACRIDEGHLHDLAVAAEYEAGIRELESPDKHLFVDFGALADLHIGSVQKGCRPDLDMGSDPDVFSANNCQKSDRCVIANFDPVSTDD